MRLARIGAQQLVCDVEQPVEAICVKKVRRTQQSRALFGVRRPSQQILDETGGDHTAGIEGHVLEAHFYG
jgi:hypothetical protein